MLKLGFVFPGQGAQYVGMGRELADKYPEAAEVFIKANEITSLDISSICFNGPQELLNQTEYAQPAILVSSLACLAVIKKYGISAEYMAGLSLGEYTALVASQSISLDKALPLVIKRASLMQNAVPYGQGAMSAVIGLDSTLVKQICQLCEGLVTIANYNCPGQVVISGETTAVNQANELVKQNGGKAIPLNISIPSHSPLMKDCSEIFAKEVNKVSFHEPKSSIVSNVNATTNPINEYNELLKKQLYMPVLWEQSIRFMLDKVDYFVEIGPGSTLSGLIKKIDRNRVLGQVDSVESLQKLLKRIDDID